MAVETSAAAVRVDDARRLPVNDLEQPSRKRSRALFKQPEAVDDVKCEQHESLLSGDVAPGSINSATADRSADHAGPTSTASRETARRRAKPPSALSYRPTHVEPAAVTTESRVKLATVCRTIITVLEDMEASSSAIEQLPITRLLDSFRHSAGAAITAMAALQSQGWTMRQGIENWEQASQITEDAFRNYEVPQGGLRDPGA